MVLTCYPEELELQQRLSELAHVEEHFQREVAQQQQQHQHQQEPLTNGNHRYLPGEEGGYGDLRLD